MIRIAAVIVTYNRKDKLRRCVNAVLGQDCSCKPDVIVVDNNSSDSTSELFTGSSACFDGRRVLYFNTGLNTGGAGGFTFGIRKACELGYDYVWLMDDDCIPAADALGVLVGFDTAHNGEYGFLSSKVLWMDGNICRMNVQRETLLHNVRDWDRKVISVAMSSFVSLFLPVRIVYEMGLPFSKFYMWTDDWEYTRRISRQHSCYLLTDSIVMHDMDRNETADISAAGEERLGRFRYLYRNDVYLYRREGLTGCAYELARIMHHTARVLRSKRSVSDKCRRIGIIVKGTFDGLSFFPEPERISADWRK